MLNMPKPAAATTSKHVLCRVDVNDKHYWLGLINDENALTSYWLDGSSSTFRRWKSGEPEADDKTCVYFKDSAGEFKDAECDKTKKYVCKANGNFSSQFKSSLLYNKGPAGL